MNCPYCAEEIEDKAIFCRYCRHDLTFFKLIRPLQDKLTSLEDRVTELSATLEKTNASLDDMRSRSQAPTASSQRSAKRRWASLPVAKDHLSVRSRVSVAVLVGLLSGLGLWGAAALYVFYRGYPSYMYAPGEETTTLDVVVNLVTLLISLIANLVIPVLGGLWIAAAWRGKHLGSYAFLGLMAGFVSALLPVSMLDQLSVFRSFPDGEMLLRIWGISVKSIDTVITTFSVTMLFLTGSLLGDRIERRRYRKSGRTQEGTTATTRGGPGVGRRGASTVIAEVLKLLQPFAPVITALLGIVGTIVTFYLNTSAQ